MGDLRLLGVDELVERGVIAAEQAEAAKRESASSEHPEPLRRYANDQIGAARVVDVCASAHTDPPQTEYHARPLVKPEALEQDGE